MPTANGKDVLGVVIEEPRVGVWSIELDADSDEALTGSVSVEVDGVTWSGTVVRGEQTYGRAHARIIGGAGKLAGILDAKFYLNSTFGTVLRDIMQASGETLSPHTDAAVLSAPVGRWARSYASGGQALRQVATELGVSWRVLRDGTVWLGTETWPVADLTYDEIDQFPSEGAFMIAPDVPTLTVGTSFAGKRVSSVTTRSTADGLRQYLLFEDDNASSHGRALADIAAVVESLVGNRIDYTRLYPARVVSQSSDDSLDVLADDVKVRGTGITAVPIRHGLPGVHAKVNPGSYVLLFFEGGDPKKPAAALWPDGSSVSAITIKADKVTIDGDLFVTGEITAKSDSLAIPLSTHEHPTAMGPTDKPIPPPPT